MLNFTNTQTYIHTAIHRCIHTYIHTYIHGWHVYACLCYIFAWTSGLHVQMRSSAQNLEYLQNWWMLAWKYMYYCAENIGYDSSAHRYTDMQATRYIQTETYKFIGAMGLKGLGFGEGPSSHLVTSSRVSAFRPEYSFLCIFVWKRSSEPRIHQIDDRHPDMCIWIPSGG